MKKTFPNSLFSISLAAFFHQLCIRRKKKEDRQTFYSKTFQLQQGASFGKKHEAGGGFVACDPKMAGEGGVARCNGGPHRKLWPAGRVSL